MVTPEAERVPVLPRPVDGVAWGEFDFPSFDGGRDSKDDELPRLFIRPGAIVATGPVHQHFGDRPDQRDELTLLVRLDADAEARGTLYEDAGEGFGYLMGAYLETTYHASIERGEVVVRIGDADGDMARPDREVTVRVIGSEMNGRFAR